MGQTLIKVISLDPAREYIGFEPQVDCCFYIDRFIADNHLANVSVLPMALSDSNGMLQLNFNSDYDAMASASPVDTSQSSWVPGRIGDEVLNEMGVSNIAVIKIDVEGTELEVLRGLEDTMKKWSPLLVFKVLANFTGEERTMRPSEARETNSRRASEIAQLLADRGYKLYQIDRKGLEIAIQAFDLDDPNKYMGRDYIARPALDSSTID